MISLRVAGYRVSADSPEPGNGFERINLGSKRGYLCVAARYDREYFLTQVIEKREPCLILIEHDEKHHLEALLEEIQATFQLLEVISYQDRLKYRKYVADLWNIEEQEIKFMTTSAKDIMIERDLITLKLKGDNEQKTVNLASDLMTKYLVGHLPIVNSSDHLIGLVSWSRIAKYEPIDQEIIGRSFEAEELTRMHEIDIFSEALRLEQNEIVFVKPDDDIGDVVRKFVGRETGVRPSIMPVLENDNELRGLVSWVDVFRNWQHFGLLDKTAEEVCSSIDNLYQVEEHDHIMGAAQVLATRWPRMAAVLHSQTRELKGVVSYRNIAKYEYTHHQTEDKEVRDALSALRFDSEFKALKSLVVPASKVQVSSDLPLWSASDKNDVIHRFTSSVDGKKHYNERLDCLLVTSSDKSFKGYISPYECMLALDRFLNG